MADQTPRLNYDDLTRRLADRVDRLVGELLPAARFSSDARRRCWVVGGLDGSEGQSLSIERFGPKRGLWAEHNGRPRPGQRFQGGNLLQLIDQVRFGGRDLHRAALWAWDWLDRPEPETRPAAKPRPQPQPQWEQAARQKATVDALRVWHAARPLMPGDPVWRYLAGRGIDLGRLAQPPGALRYHPSLYHSPGRFWPAMVAVVCDAAGRNTAIHRTWLEVLEQYEPEEHPTGVVKAPIADNKKSWGPIAGGCIHLGRGQSHRPWGSMLAGETLLLGEGIEDTLSGMLRFPQWRAAVGISWGVMLALELPPAIATIALLRQGDKPGSPADLGVERVIERFEAQGRRVLEWQRPPFVKDINELDQIHAATRRIHGRPS